MRTRLFWPFFPLLLVLITWTARTAGDVKYFAAFLNEHKIGYSIHERDASETSVNTSETIILDLQRLGNALHLEIQQTYHETNDGKPLGFAYRQTLGPLSMRITGKVNDAQQLETTMETGGFQQKRVFDWQKDALFPEGIRQAQLAQKIVPNMAMPVKTFDASVMQFIEMEIVVGNRETVDVLGRPMSLYHTKTTMRLPSGVMDSIAYIDDLAEPYKIRCNMANFTIELIACDEFTATSPNDPQDFLVNASLVACPQAIPDLNHLRSITYIIEPTEPNAALSFPTTSAQRITKTAGQTIELCAAPPSVPAEVPYPIACRQADAEVFLQPTRFIQCDDPNVIVLARRAVAGAATAAQAAARIEAFVHDYIVDKNYAIGYAAAREVLLTKQGDCTEHAILAAALCRAAGIPCRVVFGMLYVPNFSGRENVFVGHAWCTARIGEQWIDFDATRHYDRFTPGHIALAIGDGNPEDYLGMLKTFNQFKISALKDIR